MLRASSIGASRARRSRFRSISRSAAATHLRWYDNSGRWRSGRQGIFAWMKGNRDDELALGAYSSVDFCPTTIKIDLKCVSSHALPASTTSRLQHQLAEVAARIQQIEHIRIGVDAALA